MKIHLSDQKINQIEADVCALLCFENAFKKEKFFQEANKHSKGLLEQWVKSERFVGKKGQILWLQIHNDSSMRRILLIGAGPTDIFRPSELRTLATRSAKLANQVYAETMFLLVPKQACDDPSLAARFATEGASLGNYHFTKYFSGPTGKERTLKQVLLKIDASPLSLLQKAIHHGEIVAEATKWARDWVNDPPNHMTPSKMASLAKEYGKKHGLAVKVLSQKECEKLGMGLLLGVGQGSEHAPHLIHLTYKPSGKKAKKKIALIGKSVTFDTGGYAIKTLQGMLDMKTDMAGGAAVMAAILAAAQLKSPIEIHAILPAVENMISAKAFRPSDVLVSMSGRTVEINNPDAEGRLALADAITYIQKECQPDEIIDLATLTGACIAALGPSIAGLMGNNEDFISRFLETARQSGEDMWHLPLPERLRDSLNSDVADMRNTGSDRNGGALIAGLFIREFVEKSTPWIHLDIAGPSETDKEWGPYSKGGTGFGVSTLVHYLTQDQ